MLSGKLQRGVLRSTCARGLMCAILGRHFSVASTVKPGWPLCRADKVDIMADNGPKAAGSLFPTTAEDFATYVEELLAESQQIRHKTQMLKREAVELRQELRAERQRLKQVIRGLNA
jgi:hypothetical protein